MWVWIWRFRDNKISGRRELSLSCPLVRTFQLSPSYLLGIVKECFEVDHETRNVQRVSWRTGDTPVDYPLSEEATKFQSPALAGSKDDTPTGEMQIKTF